MSPDQSFLALLGMPLLLLGMAVMLRSYSNRRQLQWAQAHWQPTAGKIVESALTSHQASGIKGRGSEVFKSSVRYLYEVDGRQFESSQITMFDTHTGWSNPQDEIIARYPVNKAVTVYFDPLKPNRSALEMRLSEGSKIYPGVGGFLLVVGVLLLMRAWS